MRTRFNPKRQIDQEVSSVVLESLSERLTYGGNPEHKRNPGDFGLAPPASPRPDKSLCDEINVFTRREAVDLLREGVRRSLISKQQVRGLPQNIWAVTARGVAVEAQLENVERATYHGYPIPFSDPFAQVVLRAWSAYVE